MTVVDGIAAANTMLAFGTWRAGYCLEAVWQAYKRNGARTDRGAPTAYAGWLNSDDKHPGDRNPPAGVPVWWGPKQSSAAGDVVISLGDGRVVATDWPRNGVIGITTIDARERQIGRPYLGWTGDILGADISYPTASGGGSIGGFLMALTDAQQAQLFDMVANVYHGLYTGGPSTADGGPLMRTIAEIKANVGPISREVEGQMTAISLRQEVADAKTGVLTLLGRPVAEVDVDDVQAIAEAVVSLLPDALGTLSDETVDELVKRLLDEQSKRLAS